MTVRFVDVLTRRASAGLGADGMGMVPTPVADAKNKNKNKKRRKKTEKKARKRCQSQGEECITFFEAVCQGDVPCLEPLLPCCEFAGRCELSETLNCLFLREA